jgi:hypothetical protein
MTDRQIAELVVVCSVILVAAGCGGSNRGAIRGKVTADGKPLQEGEISFVPVEPKLGPTAGAVVTNGEYRIDAARGPFAGEHQVQINAFRPTGKKRWDGMGDEKAPAGQRNYVEEVENFIPAKYNSASGLRAVIKAGEVNVYDFDLILGGPK